MGSFIFNGSDVVKASTLGLSYDNRGVLFGETIFTSLRTYEGKILFLSDHLERLRLNINYFFPEHESDWSVLREKIIQGLYLLIQKVQAEKGDLALRITLYPSTEGFPDMAKSFESIKFYIMATPVDYSLKDIHKIQVAIMTRTQSRNGLPTYIKTGTYMESARILRMIRLKGYDDVIFMNEQEFLLEAATSNLFFRCGKMIYTPDTQMGILAGVTRNHLIRCLTHNGFEVREGLFTKQDLMDASEVWLSSSIKGIRVISSIEGKEFSKNKDSASLLDYIVNLYENYCKNFEDGKNGN